MKSRGRPGDFHLINLDHNVRITFFLNLCLAMRCIRACNGVLIDGSRYSQLSRNRKFTVKPSNNSMLKWYPRDFVASGNSTLSIHF